MEKIPVTRLLLVYPVRTDATCRAYEQYNVLPGNLRVVANDVSPGGRVAHARALLAAVDDVINSRLHGVLEGQFAESLHDLGVAGRVFVGQQGS